MRPQNLLIIMADEHNPKVLGCAGHPEVKTPNLDHLASTGVRFSAAYTASPICVPARAAFATGRYVWRMGYWDNADPYDGRIPSWQHYLRSLGHDVVSIGKLHFRGREADDHGFSREHIPMHVEGGTGNLKTSIRDMSSRRDGSKLLALAGPGESAYTRYDRDIASQAQSWIRGQARGMAGKPWVLFVSFVAPHFPLTAPAEWYSHYAKMQLRMPKLYGQSDRLSHACLQYLSEYMDYGRHFKTDEDVRRALAGYYGLTSFADHHVGQVLGALEGSGLASDTRVIYLSDHGDNLGARGLWGKSTMFQESVGVPLIVRGADLPHGRVCTEPVSLVDLFPFVLECVGAPSPEFEDELSGVSLSSVLSGTARERAILSEYHAVGSTSAVYMLRRGRFKYVHYLGEQPQLFDLDSDAEELHDLATDIACAPLISEFNRELRSILDPEEVDQRAKRRQMTLVEQAGGRSVVLNNTDFAWTSPPAAVVPG